MKKKKKTKKRRKKEKKKKTEVLIWSPSGRPTSLKRLNEKSSAS